MPTPLAPGDVFAIPASPAVRAFGRVMRVTPGVGFLTEVFAHTDGGDGDVQTSTLEASGRLFRPLHVSTSSYEKAGWKRLRRDPEFDGGDWAEIGFVLGRGDGGVRIHRGASNDVVPETVAASMEEMIVNPPGRITYMVREHLGLLPQSDG